MENHFSVNYNTNKLNLFFKDEEFEFDLNEGDVGDFWYAFQHSNGNWYDLNFTADKDAMLENVSIYGMELINNELSKVNWEYENINILNKEGDIKYYFKDIGDYNELRDKVEFEYWNQSYGFFLFTKLADKLIDEDLSFDLMHGKLLSLYVKFLNSKFNVDTKSEYDCIIDFVKNELEK